MWWHHGSRILSLVAGLVDIRSLLIAMAIITCSLSSLVVGAIICISRMACDITTIHLLRSNLSLARSSMSWLLALYLNLLTCLLSWSMLNWRRLKVLVRGIRWIIVLTSVWVVVRIVKNYIRWKSFNDPLMLQSLIRRQTLLRIPLKTFSNEVDEWGVGHLSELVHDVSESLLFLIICQYLKWCRHGIIFELGEELLSLGVLENLLRRHANHINYQLQLLFLICARE